MWHNTMRITEHTKVCQNKIMTEILSVKFDNIICMCFQHINLTNIHLMLVRIFWKLYFSGQVNTALLWFGNISVALF